MDLGACDKHDCRQPHFCRGQAEAMLTCMSQPGSEGELLATSQRCTACSWSAPPQTHGPSTEKAVSHCHTAAE